LRLNWSFIPLGIIFWVEFYLQSLESGLMARGTLKYQIFSADVDRIAVTVTDRLSKVILRAGGLR
jgi:hypothetical protein